MTKPIVSFLALPDMFTIANALSGTMSIFFAMQKSLFPAVLFIVLAAFFDFFDGFAARKMKRKGDFGKQLDSLADVVSFVIAPVVLGFSFLAHSPLTIIALLFFVAMGILRLARFNIQTAKGFFIGVPTTVAALGISLIFLYVQNTMLLSLSYFLFAILMISHIKIKKVGI